MRYLRVDKIIKTENTIVVARGGGGVGEKRVVFNRCCVWFYKTKIIIGLDGIHGYTTA